MSEPATIVVKAQPESIKQVRDFVGLVFGTWGLEDYLARTVATELATNAIRHGSVAGDPVVVRTYLLDGRPVIEAWDRSDTLPVVRPVDLASERGRGLLMMDALVRRWGTRPLSKGGKVVWAECEPVALSAPSSPMPAWIPRRGTEQGANRGPEPLLASLDSP